MPDDRVLPILTEAEMRPHDHPHLHQRSPLPETRNTDGRPVWEPPVLQYYWLIDEETTQKLRDAVLKHYKGDVAQTTKCIDTRTEVTLLKKHIGWTKGQGEEHGGDLKKATFFMRLLKNLQYELQEVQLELDEFQIVTVRLPGGSYEVHDTKEYYAQMIARTEALAKRNELIRRNNRGGKGGRGVRGGRGACRGGHRRFPQASSGARQALGETAIAADDQNEASDDTARDHGISSGSVGYQEQQLQALLRLSNPQPNLPTSFQPVEEAGETTRLLTGNIQRSEQEPRDFFKLVICGCECI